jgi:hypothetical protein
MRLQGRATTHAWLAACASIVLATGALACGETHRAFGSRTRPPGGYLHKDGDKDEDETLATAGTGDDRNFSPSYGSSANRADTRAIARLLRRYFAAAVAGNARTACSLLDATIVRELEQIEGQAGAGDCTQAVSAALAQQHSALTADDPATMTVIFVHVKGDFGLAALGFTTAPEQEITLEREDGNWKVDALSGGYMT